MNVHRTWGWGPDPEPMYKLLLPPMPCPWEEARKPLVLVLALRGYKHHP
jgi:hypothetical protein